ncbi:hypothetical protein Asi03nite_61760 [Actinoplanes siamensis]|uniref:Uncharacterized protein n=2 Tax=Actinoplanes siamensis TaxID=1223317 RepID=A0A919NCI6_9ACTN|nr:hypothetical protein Asi03nite_61760 [Actinoplanes siamensis]
MLKNGKAIVALLVALVVAAWPQLFGNHRLDLAEGITLAAALVAVLVTYLVPLVPSAPWLKTLLFAATAGLGVATAVVPGGITSDELLLILGAVASALGVWAAPAASTTGVSVGWGPDQYDLAA